MESIYNIWKKIKAEEEALFITLIILGVGVLGFELGRLSTIEEGREPIRVSQSGEGALASTTLPLQNNKGPQALTASVGNSQGASIKGKYVASKNGKSYYLPWCSGVNRIKEENKVWFNTAEEARAKGYQPAANCKGVE